MRRRRRRRPRFPRSRSVDGFADLAEAKFFVWPALAEDALEVWSHDALVSIGETGIELNDGLACAFDEAACFAMRHGHVATDEVMGELDDHSNTAEPPTLDKRGWGLLNQLDFEFRHRGFTAGNAGPAAGIPRKRLQVAASEAGGRRS